MNRIYGIGLPRTGTTSLAKALHKLGQTTRHFCVLHDSEYMKYDSQDVAVFIDNSFYMKCKETIEDILLTKYTNSLFILTTRDRSDWYSSISKFYSIPKDLPDINIYTKLIKSIFKSLHKEKQLLIINIFDDSKCVEKICDFIQVPYQDLTFPHAKKEHEIDLNSILEKHIVLTKL